MSDRTSERVAVVTANGRSLPVLMCSIDSGVPTNSTLHLSGEQIGERGGRATIGHVNQVDAGHHLEQFAGSLGCTADADRSHVDLAGIGFGISDKLGNGFGGKR